MKKMKKPLSFAIVFAMLASMLGAWGNFGASAALPAGALYFADFTDGLDDAAALSFDPGYLDAEYDALEKSLKITTKPGAPANTGFTYQIPAEDWFGYGSGDELGYIVVNMKKTYSGSLQDPGGVHMQVFVLSDPYRASSHANVPSSGAKSNEEDFFAYVEFINWANAGANGYEPGDLFKTIQIVPFGWGAADDAGGSVACIKNIAIFKTKSEADAYASSLNMANAKAFLLYEFNGGGWANQFASVGTPGDSCHIGYDGDEGALKIVTRPKTEHGQPFAYVDLALKARDYKTIAADGSPAFQYAVACAKTADRSPSVGAELFHSYLWDIPPVGSNHASYAFFNAASDYSITKVACGDALWGDPLEAGDVMRTLRLMPFGGANDESGGSTAYIRYIAFFETEAQADAFISSYEYKWDSGASEQPDRIVFDFENEDLNSMFNSWGGGGSPGNLYYDPAEGALKIESKASDVPYTYFDFALSDDYKCKWGSGLPYALVCMKSIFSDAHAQQPMLRYVDMCLTNGTNWSNARIWEDSEEYSIYRVECIDPLWGASRYNWGDPITILRIFPFGTAPDPASESAAYIKYIAFFSSEAEMDAFIKEKGYYSVNAKPNGGGTVKGQTGLCEAGSTVTLEASPDPKSNWEFVSWSAPGLPFDGSGEPTANFTMPASDVSLTANFKHSNPEPSEIAYKATAVVESKVIDWNHPGSNAHIGISGQATAKNDYGYENGYAIDINGVYHMLMTELWWDVMWNITGSTLGSVPGRIGYWQSHDKGISWTRICTIVTGTATEEYADYSHVKNNTWSSSWYWDENAYGGRGCWNIFWRGAQIFYYEGTEEIAGIYDLGALPWENYFETTLANPVPPAGKWGFVDVGPERGSPLTLVGDMQSWDYGMDSFGNVYQGTDGRYYSFVGSGVPDMKNDEQWVNALLWSDDPLSGIWHRYENDTHPTFVYSENPYVFEYFNSQGQKVYFTVFDDLVNQKSIGFGWSYNGFDWKYDSIDLSGHADWSRDIDLISTIRTPCCLLYDGETDTYVIIFTAFGDVPAGRNPHNIYASIGRVAVKIEEIAPEKQPPSKYVMFPGDMGDWESESGYNFVQYGREFSLDGRKAVNGGTDSATVVYKGQTYGDGIISADLYYAEPNWTHMAQAGVFARAEADGTGGYRAYLSASNTESDNLVLLYKGTELVQTASAGKKPGIHRTLTLETSGNIIKVYYEGDLIIEYADEANTYASGYSGIEALWSHWHYARVEIASAEELEPKPEIEVVGYTATTSATNLQNNATVTITVYENYSDGSSAAVASASVKLKQNSAQTVKVGDYDVTVVVNGNNKITDVYVGVPEKTGGKNNQGDNQQ